MEKCAKRLRTRKCRTIIGYCCEDVHSIGWQCTNVLPLSLKVNIYRFYHRSVDSSNDLLIFQGYRKFSPSQVQLFQFFAIFFKQQNYARILDRLILRKCRAAICGSYEGAISLS